MTNSQSTNKLLYKCPCCKQYFNPSRLNQLYCIREHGWRHRNLLKTSTNITEVELEMGLLGNLKKLNKFSFSSCEFLDKETFESLKLDLNYLKPIKSPDDKSDFDSITKWFEVHGYVIKLHDTGSCILYKPSFFKVR